MTDLFKQMYELIWKEIFPNLPVLAIDDFKNYFTQDLSLPILKKCYISDKELYISPEYDYKRFVDRSELMKRDEIDNHMEPKTQINSLRDILSKISQIAYYRASRLENSEVIEESDDIHSSSFIYNSTHVYSCQKILFSYNMAQSELIMASKGSKSCSFGIKLYDSSSVSNSFDVSWSAKCSNSYFCHNCYGLRDCLFCFHLSSKQYCIANMQFSEEEYKKLKNIILNEYYKQLSEPNGFKVLSDI